MSSLIRKSIYISTAFLVFYRCQPSSINSEKKLEKADTVLAVHKPIPVVEYGGDTIKIDRSLDYLMGKFKPEDRPEFVEVDLKHADRAGLYLRKDTYDAFIKMYDAAHAADIQLIIRSATRNFEYQKGIWERKWSGETALEAGIHANNIADAKMRALEILKYSSMPGTSRHHWGTDVDFNSFSNSYFEKGDGLVLYNWLTEHAESFGFCRPYTTKDVLRPNGYEEEKWHWSYWPVASQLLEVADEKLSDHAINGFLGAEQATVIHVVDNYVHGINPECKLHLTNK